MSPARRRAQPFLISALIGQALGIVPGAATRWSELLAALAVTAAVAAIALFAPWERLPRAVRLVPPLLYVAAVALMRDAAGGAVSGFGPLYLLPVLWVALYGTRGELVVILAGVAAAFYVPLLAIGGHAYPLVGWRAGGLFVMVASIIGLTAHGLIARLRAVSGEREELAERFRRLAVTDPLTGLPNRRAWDAELARTLSAARVTGTSVCVAVLDLDHFKRLNDAYGHAHGDDVLRAAACAWEARLRPSDLLARVGGEEFGLLLTCPLGEALAAVERVRTAMPPGATCSAGVAEWDGEEEADALLARADAMLYRAKAEGRDRTVPAAPADAPALRLLSSGR